MSPTYERELQALDRSWPLYIRSFVSSATGCEVTEALYRQPDGSSKLHILDTSPESPHESFVDDMDADNEARFLWETLAIWDGTLH